LLQKKIETGENLNDKQLPAELVSDLMMAKTIKEFLEKKGH
jgi:hypothetical protein